jgi:hypothetical protein
VASTTTGSAAVGEQAMVPRFTQTHGVVLVGTLQGVIGWIDAGGVFHAGLPPL